MSAKSKETIQAEVEVVVSAIETLETSLQAELDTYGSWDGDCSILRDWESCLEAIVAQAVKAGLLCTGIVAQVGERHGLVS